MLVMLEPRQVGDYWELIKEALYHSGIPTMGPESEAYPNVLASLLNGELASFLYGKYDQGVMQSVEMVVVAGIITDSFSLTKNLIIYALWSIHGNDKWDWLEGLNTLKKFARAHNCINIFGYSNNLKMISMAQALGFDSSQTLLRMEV